MCAIICMRMIIMENVLCLDIFPKFKCKCDKCRHTCCAYWKVGVKESDYNRITNLSCSIDTKELFELESFKTLNRYAHIRLLPNGKCPALRNGMCSLQIEAGIDALTKTCMDYPRLIRNIYGPEIALSTACEGVVELLNKEAYVDMIHTDSHYDYEYSVNQDFIKKPDVRSDLINIMRNDLPLEDRFSNIRAYLSKYNKDILDIDMRYNKSVHYYLKGIYEEMLKERAINTGYKDFFGDYISLTNDKNVFITNILINHMFYMNFPFCNNSEDIISSYVGLYTMYLFTRYIIDTMDDINDIADTISYIYRMSEHSSFYDKCLGYYYELR